MMGIKYLRMMADRLKKPLVILLAMGSNSGSHIGTSPLSQVTQNYSGFLASSPLLHAEMKPARPIILRFNPCGH